MADDELRRRLIEKARAGIKTAYESEEYALMQAIDAWLELSKGHNLAMERLSEWMGIYAPEIKVGGPEALAKLAMAVSEGRTDRDSMAPIVGAERAGDVSAKLSGSMGRKMNQDESKALSAFAGYGLKSQAAMEALEEYLKAASNRILPNVTYLTDEKIAAELLSKAGSMEKLATMPASTVQLLGAEKALFKHIKYGSKPPKYGILFKLADVTSAPKDMKGRIARVYATKLSIALKADYFSKRFIGDQLKKDLDESIKRIRESPPRERKPERRQERPFRERGGMRRAGKPGRPFRKGRFPSRKGGKS